MTDFSERHRRLDKMLAELPEPVMRADLAANIVARATALLQQARHKDLVVTLPQITWGTARTGRRFNRWFATGMAATLAAGTASVIVGQPDTEMPSQARTLVPKPQSEAGERDRAMARSSGPASPAQQAAFRSDIPDAAPPPRQPRGRQQKNVAMAAAGSPEAGASPEPAKDIARSTAEPDLQATSELAGNTPPRPVQGPPVPEDLKFGQGESGPVVGYGITGSAVRPAPAPMEGPAPAHRSGTIRR